MKKGLPFDISRCSNDECVRRHYCKRWIDIPPGVILTYSQFDSKNCEYFIDDR